ncbi:fungal specific transcription factor [Colletotrichum tabaci]|uniref:Fungal specific transcription factor n=1 Tax=Colletotrichum tabaci TaxID=1209068 RepID=A0AAV9SVA6_9PEZI
MPDESAQLNPLSVRCSRLMPVCERCKAHNTECVYPQRVKRKVTRTLTDRLSLDASSTTDGALSTILERLQRVERHCTTISAPSRDLRLSEDRAPDETPAPPPPPPLVPPPPRQASISSSIPNSIYNSVPSTFPSPAASSAAGGQATSSPWTSLATPCAAPELDVASILKDAVDQVQRLQLQAISAAVITQNVRIPPELAKTWIKNYFTHMHIDMFLSLVNPKLIEMIPDLLEMPHVHLEPAILVVYYGILYHGCALGSTSQEVDEGQKYCQMLYVCCLRSLPLWQREATGTTTDLIAALFMCRTAAECLDEELSWKMYAYSCEYAQTLNLHNLDAHGSGSGSGSLEVDEAKLDADRKGFWELIQIDFFFRLLFNRPPAITDSMSTWKVNLPWLSGSTTMDLDAVPAVTFIMSSRLTFILSQFYRELENPDSDEATVRLKTEEYCREIGRLFAEYQLDDWIQRAFASGARVDSWVLGDVALTGYTYIIFMLRKLAVLRSSSPRPVSCDADVPDSPLAVDAARGILRLMSSAMEHNPYPESMCVLMGMYRAYVPCACLFASVLRSADVRERAEDVGLLETLVESMERASRGEREFAPLLKAVRSLGMEVKRRMEEASSMPMA